MITSYTDRCIDIAGSDLNVDGLVEFYLCKYCCNSIWAIETNIIEELIELVLDSYVKELV